MAFISSSLTVCSSSGDILVIAVSSSLQRVLVDPINCPPGSVVVSDVSWGPQKVKSFVHWVVCDAWGSASNLMRDGGVVWNVATWHLLIGGINGMPLGFPAAFQFPWVFGFLKNFSFPSFWFFPSCFISDITPISFRWLWLCSGDKFLRWHIFLRLRLFLFPRYVVSSIPRFIFFTSSL